jgi:hypothetical protein
VQDYIVETKIADDKSLTIKGLPFCVGDKVEVIIRPSTSLAAKKNNYTLRGEPIRYIDPFESVAEEDWETLK